MELRFDTEKCGLPKDWFISVRAGDVRRQAPVIALKDHALNFPQPVESIKIDVLRPVFRGQQVLNMEQEKQYALNVPMGPESEVVECMMTVKKGVSSPSVKQTPNKESQKYIDAAASAKSYLEEHKLLEVVQEVLENTIKDKPDKPRQYIWNQMKEIIEGSNESVIKNTLMNGTEISEEDRQRFTTAEKKLEESVQLREELALKLKDIEERLASNGKTQEALATAENKSREMEEKVKKLEAQLAEKAGVAEKQGSEVKESMPNDSDWQQKCDQLAKAEKRADDLQADVENLKANMERWPLLKAKFEQLEQAEKARDALRGKYDELEAMFRQLKEQREVDTKNPRASKPPDQQLTEGDAFAENKALFDEKCEELRQAEEKRKELENAVNKMQVQLDQIQASQAELKKAKMDT